MAKQFGLSAEQTSALATAMLSLGKTPEIAATGINALLLKLQTGKTQGRSFRMRCRVSGSPAASWPMILPPTRKQRWRSFLPRWPVWTNKAAETLARLFGQNTRTTSPPWSRVGSVPKGGRHRQRQNRQCRLDEP